ncbi:hydrogenase nickel incorporation protein HypB [Nocardia implantans]|uniref:Hydrogenase nickel incorporation protein HypB n=1 Tax=Nocardia implantans TaxID=3108168 RepID=A0ABU6AZT1_9NOCA|nr:MULTISPECIES: hydrogenase nickel incorporation protein HypB [unclassified Nocardia]MBF6195047.1 hydrogenase nickel incorporation protein HypB [Nocardia beijingensis]MEA3530909.1 hydrogenase nickel incorporation protein HypB [Nocardia sp. CDC192]MEB3512961.1 hydrogenase nickel incorporation protein HypB [Nocardia sp. CDC186]
MCATCGCGDDAAALIRVPHDHQHADGHDHTHADHEHPHEHGSGADHAHVPATETVTLELKVLAKNDELAQRNRAWLAERGIVALNMTSSPGAGKTTLLERTIRESGQAPIAVIEGDQATLLDAERIEATGCRVVQVNTGAGCHLDAEMMYRALETLDPAPGTLLFVENVGNLVCPALFDLGERAKVVVISVTEGTDKPLKYPHMFQAAGLVLVNKTDLLPYVDFDLDRCREYIRSIHPGVEVLPLSVSTGEGLSTWYDWLADERRAAGTAALEDAAGRA